MIDIEVGNNNNNNTNGENQENLQRQREIFDAAQKRAKSATNILKSMSDLRDTGSEISPLILNCKADTIERLPL